MIFFNKAVCGGKITDLNGAISSPNFPEHYPANIVCQWIIEMPPDHFIELNFVLFSVKYFIIF